MSNPNYVHVLEFTCTTASIQEAKAWQFRGRDYLVLTTFVLPRGLRYVLVRNLSVKYQVCCYSILLRVRSTRLCWHTCTHSSEVNLKLVTYSSDLCLSQDPVLVDSSAEFNLLMLGEKCKWTLLHFHLLLFNVIKSMSLKVTCLQNHFRQHSLEDLNKRSASRAEPFSGTWVCTKPALIRRSLPLLWKTILILRSLLICSKAAPQMHDRKVFRMSLPI